MSSIDILVSTTPQGNPPWSKLIFLLTRFVLLKDIPNTNIFYKVDLYRLEVIAGNRNMVYNYVLDPDLDAQGGEYYLRHYSVLLLVRVVWGYGFSFNNIGRDSFICLYILVACCRVVTLVVLFKPPYLLAGKKTQKENQVYIFKKIDRFGSRPSLRSGIQQVSGYFNVEVTSDQVHLLNLIPVDTIKGFILKDYVANQARKKLRQRRM